MKKNKIITIDLSKKSIQYYKNYLGLFVLIFCSIIGVGFVSGAEICEFFTRFGKYSYLGIFVLFLLVYFVVNKMLIKNLHDERSKSMDKTENLKKQCYNKQEILYKNINKKARIINNFKILNNRKIKEKIYSIVIFINVFVIAGAMFSGLNHLIKSLYKNNYIFVFMFVLIVVFLLLFFGVEWLKKTDYFVLTFAIFVSICLLISVLNGEMNCYNFNTKIEMCLSENNNGFDIKKFVLSMIFPALYVFMNFFQTQPVIETTGRFITTKKQCKIFSLIFSLIFSSVVIIFVLFLSNNNELSLFSMPLLEYFSFKGGIIKNIFCSGLVLSLLTTLISCLIGIKHNLLKILPLNNFHSSFLSFFIAFVFGFLPFNFFVSVAYPVLGLLNFVIFVFC